MRRWHAACLVLEDMKTAPRIRHDRGWFTSALCAAALLSLSPPRADSLEAANAENVAQLESLVRAAAVAEFPPLSERQRFVVGPIEPHTQLPKCAQPVRTSLASLHHMQDRANFELRCPDFQGWHLYVPVRIVGTSQAAVAVHALVIGAVLQASDLRVEQHDVSELPLGFLDDPAVAVGLTVSRPIAGGAFITNQQLVASKAVQRGQSVTLMADAGGMTIRMAGRALTDALVNQRVRVTNLSSGKVVEGIARSAQTVEIILQ
jgi:flagella basal body P-ring formation protein FlgA